MTGWKIVTLLALIPLMAGCSAVPTDGFGIEQTNSLPSPDCQRIGRVEARSYLGAGNIGAGTGHYLARRAALQEAPPELMAQSTHVVWEPSTGFAVDVAVGVLFRCPKA